MLNVEILRDMVLDALGCLADAEFQERVWVRGEGAEVSSFVEVVCQLFDDSALNELLESGTAAEVLGPAATAELRKLEQLIDALPSGVEERTLLQMPVWKQIMDCAQRARTLLGAASHARARAVTRPRATLRLGHDVFSDEGLCLGSQLVRILRVIGATAPRLHWYAADVEAVGPRPPSLDAARSAQPRLMGTTEDLISAVREINQFESGVFAGVARSFEHPRFRDGGLWTEDEEDADIGDAIVELRAFDFTYWSLAARDTRFAAAVRERVIRSLREPSDGAR